MSKLLKMKVLALMLACASQAIILPMTSDIAAFAKNGSDGGNSGSGSSGSGNSGSGNGGSGNSGSDSHSDSGGDDSSSNDSNDSNSSGDDNGFKDGKKAAKATARPTTTLSLSPSDLADVVAGRSVVVDQLGRQLEVSVRSVNGVSVITGKPHGGDSKRNPGPITSVSVVSTASLPANDDGTPDQGPGDN